MSAAEVRARLRGPMAPLVTPFAPSLDIDWAAFDAHVTRLLSHGVEVLVPADLVGEAWALTVEEKARLFARTVELSASRAAVVAKISAPALPAAMELARAAREAGVDAIKVPFPTESADGASLQTYVEAAIADSGLPFLVETSAADVPVTVLDRLAARPDFVGIEETALDLDRFDWMVQHYGARVPVIAGSEDVLGFTLLLGASGFMTATPNFAPGFMRELWEAAAAGQARATLDLCRRLRRYRRLFQHDLRAGRPMFVPYTKAALELLGHPVGHPRPPLRSLTDSERDVLRATLREAFGLEPAR